MKIVPCMQNSFLGPARARLTNLFESAPQALAGAKEILVDPGMADIEHIVPATAPIPPDVTIWQSTLDVITSAVDSRSKLQPSGTSRVARA